MYVIYQGESLVIPAVVTGDKSLISGVTAVIKASQRGEVPLESAPVLATFSVSNYTSLPEVAQGYLFTLANTNSLAPGIYYVNFEYVVSSLSFKGVPKRVTIKESVV
jgi:hypothetical protein